jgi:hypothetical protein
VLTTECPGITFLCKRAFNENAYCGTAASAGNPSCEGDAETGFFCRNAANEGASCANAEGSDGDSSLCQPSTATARPENGFCLSNPTGICSGGPSFGLPCDTPHGFPSAQCPPNPAPPPPSNVLVELPIPPGTSFVDADNGGTSNGSVVQWTMPPQFLCGGANEPTCPELNARLLIDSLVPEGTAFQNTVTATDQDGFVISGPQLTTVARFLVQALVLAYPVNADARDRVTYRAKFGLLATETITPGAEEFRFNVSTAGGTVVEFVVPAGQLPESSIGQWTYYPPARGLPGLKNVRLRLIGPGQYALRVRASQMTLPDLDSLNVTVTINIGDDTFTHPARMLVKRGGQRYVAARSTTTTTIVSPPTTTTTVFGATSTSTSITTSSTLDTTTTSNTVDSTTTTSSTLDTTTTSNTLDTTTTSSTLDTTTTSSTLDTTTTSSTLDTTTTSSTLDTTTTSSTLDTTTTSSTLDTTTTSSTIETTTTIETSTTSSTTETSTSTSTTESSTSTSTSSTTSTTALLLIPCGGLISPVCDLGNDCPVGTTCQPDPVIGQPCFCQ